MKVQGSQLTRPPDVEINVDTVYYRTNIQGHPGEWEYDEEQLTYREYLQRELAHVLDVEAVAAIPFVVMAQAEQIDDVTITEHSDLFADWDINWTGKRGTILRDEGELYRVLHDVGAGQNTKPSTDNGSLWQRIGNPFDEWPEWVPYLGIGDAYRLGDKVSHNGKHWICTAVGGDGIWNIWEPGVYGWTEAK